MFAKKSNGGVSQIDSLIGKGTRIEGVLRFTGGLHVDGEISGRVIAESGPSKLVLSEHAKVDGDVCVGHLVINGTITGPVRVTEFLEMQPKARIVGDVEYASIEMHQGAVIEGRLLLAKEPIPEKSD
ncbi:polymer-forming cytoskeletal protein [Azovibrio restrictus]|uniref:bactofilin family protein n=1 Tax=Azovibrio restrictus TaxID=146938 RepID=UPI0026F33D29|nr:polymer-forming cytoskeletal protein [Azovibrio restrictus]MDD3483044.1 polymer-forming cytoskeletal protein [Azovibrio restrictus]